MNEPVNPLVWQQSIPKVAWGTVALLIGILLGYSIVIPAALSGHLPYSVACLVCTYLCYASFTVMHDAGHGGIFALDSKYKSLETVMGWIASVPLLLGSFRFFKIMHDRHHAYTNDPDRDPDQFNNPDHWFSLIINIYCIPARYYNKLMTVYKNDPACRAAYRSTFVYLLAIHGSLLGLMLSGYLIEVLCFALIPMLITLFLLVMFFDYLPHRPHKSLDRFSNASILPSRLLNFLLFGQNYHLVHHLYPRVPWYKYQEVYNNMAEQLTDARPENLLHHVLKVERILLLTHNTIAIEFSLPAAIKAQFKPGQYITLSKWLSGRYITRCYSICSQPSENTLTIAVKQTNNGIMSRYLNNQLCTGDELVVKGPFGDFNYDSGQATHSLVLLAGGSGITPIYSILQSALRHNNDCQITLIYACRNQQEVIFGNELQALQTQYSHQLHINIVFSQTQGRITQAGLKTLLPTSHSNTEFFICGPTGFNDVVYKTLAESKVAANNLHIEQFTLAKQTAKGQRFAVTLRQSQQTQQQISVAENQSLLTVALEHNIAINHACGTGTCGSCKCKIIEGEVTPLTKLNALTEHEIKQGFVLACQSKPRSDLLIDISAC